MVGAGEGDGVVHHEETGVDFEACLIVGKTGQRFPRRLRKYRDHVRNYAELEPKEKRSIIRGMHAAKDFPFEFAVADLSDLHEKLSDVDADRFERLFETACTVYMGPAFELLGVDKKKARELRLNLGLPARPSGVMSCNIRWPLTEAGVISRWSTDADKIVEPHVKHLPLLPGIVRSLVDELEDIGEDRSTAAIKHRVRVLRDKYVAAGGKVDKKSVFLNDLSPEHLKLLKSWAKDVSIAPGVKDMLATKLSKLGLEITGENVRSLIKSIRRSESGDKPTKKSTSKSQTLPQLLGVPSVGKKSVKRKDVGVDNVQKTKQAKLQF